MQTPVASTWCKGGGNYILVKPTLLANTIHTNEVKHSNLVRNKVLRSPPRSVSSSIWALCLAIRKHPGCRYMRRLPRAWGWTVDDHVEAFNCSKPRVAWLLPRKGENSPVAFPLLMVIENQGVDTGGFCGADDARQGLTTLCLISLSYSQCQLLVQKVFLLQCCIGRS